MISAEGLRPPLQGTGLPPEPRLAPPPPPAAARSRMKVSKYCTARAWAPHLFMWQVGQVSGVEVSTCENRRPGCEVL